MRFANTIWGAFLLFAAIVLSSASFAHENPPALTVIGVVGGNVEMVVAGDDCTSMECDDCCARHGTKGSPCSSSSCCIGHCVGRLPAIDTLGKPLLESSAIVLRISDQAFPSTVGSPPYRPPCA